MLGSAYGSTLAILSLYLHGRGHSAESIGALAAWYALGIVCASIPVGSVVRRFGARAVMPVALLGYALVTALLPRVHGEGAVALLRALDGAFSVGVWVSAETTLLARSRPDQKASVTSLYAVALSVGYVLGPLGARLLGGALTIDRLFDVAAIVSVLAAAVALALSPIERRDERDEGDVSASASAPAMSLWAVVRRLPTSIVAVFVYGYFQSALLLFLPLYLTQERRLSQAATIQLPAVFAGGMLLFSPVVGRLGDRVGPRPVLRVAVAVGLVAIGLFAQLTSYWAMCVAVFVAGATLTAAWPLGLALQGHALPPREYSRGNSLVNACYAAGLVLGPPLASRVFRLGSGGALFGHLGLLWLAVLLVSLVDRAERTPAR